MTRHCVTRSHCKPKKGKGFVGTLGKIGSLALIAAGAVTAQPELIAAGVAMGGVAGSGKRKLGRRKRKHQYR